MRGVHAIAAAVITRGLTSVRRWFKLRAAGRILSNLWIGVPRSTSRQPYPNTRYNDTPGEGHDRYLHIHRRLSAPRRVLPPIEIRKPKPRLAFAAMSADVTGLRSRTSSTSPEQCEICRPTATLSAVRIPDMNGVNSSVTLSNNRATLEDRESSGSFRRSFVVTTLPPRR